MTKIEAVKILNQIHGKQYSYIKDWGLSTVKEAVRTLQNRILNENQRQLLEDIEVKLYRKW